MELVRAKIFFIVAIAFGVVACKSSPKHDDKTEKPAVLSQLITPKSTLKSTFPTTIGEIPLPDGGKSVNTDSNKNAFSYYLKNIKLKPQGTLVKLYNGDEKYNQKAHFAVIDLPIGTKDLHQCADAVMRIRADFLRHENLYNALHFNFTNGFSCEYAKWIDGFRVKIEGNKTTWFATNLKGDSDENYWKYLELVWMYAGTLSLEKELISKKIEAIAAGDVWIKGGSPGHAVLVVDVTENNKGEKIFLLAQSYMPAQEMHILKNPSNADLSPWYSLPKTELITPEWTFEQNQLKTWAQ